MKVPYRIYLIIICLSVLVSACNSEPADPPSQSVSVVAAAPSSSTDITVYKSPTCGCCKGWVTYLEEEGFKVTAIDHDDVNSIKVELGLLDPKLKSCHTAVVDGFIVEGHVPASDIKRLLSERPSDIKGLSAPGMPTMSPGMGSRTPKDYAVLSFTESGETAIFSQY